MRNKIILLVNGMRVNPPGGEELMIRGDISVRGAEQRASNALRA